MAKYVLAIDESGCFTFGSKDKSFACGVVIEANELTLKQAYQKVYEDFEFPQPIPNDTNGLLKTNDNIEDKARFHFNKLSEQQANICKEQLLKFAKRVYVSRDKPAVFANNQNWWLISIIVVIEKFLKDYPFVPGSDIEILMDNRKDNVWGIVRDDKNQGNNLDFHEYHNALKQQIENRVRYYAVQKNLTLNLSFKSDTSSFYVNLADLVCGFVRKDRCAIGVEIVAISCKSFTDGVDVAKMANQYPLSALNSIFQEVMNNDCSNVYHAKDLIKRLRTDNEKYVLAWDAFNEFLKLKIESRSTDSALVGSKKLVVTFLNEFQNTKGQYLKGEQRLELATHFVEYYSHIGEVILPIDEVVFDTLLKNIDKNSETRVLRRWEKKVSFVLRQSQIRFNAYDFENFRMSIEQCYSQHEKIVNTIELLKDEHGKIKDEPTTALLGTLAQTYAYMGNMELAEEYFELSKEYAIKSTARTDSYLFCIHHHQKNVEACRKDFETVCKKTPERYVADKDYSDLWTLLLYCKLRALELHINGNTALYAIDLSTHSKYNSEYPFPLIMKWEAIALWLENPTENRAIIETYFSNAIDNLLNPENGFVIRTLALSIIQCYGIVNNRNRFHARYNTLLNELINVDGTNGFKIYIQTSNVLKSITNYYDIWERALSLAFIYS